MFEKRELRVKLDKVDKNPTSVGPQDKDAFEKKAVIVRHQIEHVAVKMFVGVCVYVILDTARQLAVSRVN